MVINSENKNGLKGLHNLAQGNALGLIAGRRIVRAQAFIKEKFMLRTKMMVSYFPKIDVLQFPASGRLASERNWMLLVTLKLKIK